MRPWLLRDRIRAKELSLKEGHVCEESKTEETNDSLSLEVICGPIQTHDQILFLRLQAKTARGSNQEVAGLTSSSLGILG